MANKKSEWEAISKVYNRLTPPDRPSLEVVRNTGKLIAKYFKNRKHPLNILVMGSTTETRRILYNYEFLYGDKITCIDANPDMYRATSELLVREGTTKEKFVSGSWLDTKLSSNSFDFVFGDEVICNIPLDLHDKLFTEISRVMKKDGLWITRHNFWQEKTQRKVATILTDLAKQIIEDGVAFQEIINILFIEMFYHKSVVSHNSVKKHLEVIKKEVGVGYKNINEKYRDVVKKIVKLYESGLAPVMGDYKWYMLDKKESDKEIIQYFKILDVVIAKDFPTEKNSPIYVLKKK